MQTRYSTAAGRREETGWFEANANVLLVLKIRRVTLGNGSSERWRGTGGRQTGFKSEGQVLVRVVVNMFK